MTYKAKSMLILSGIILTVFFILLAAVIQSGGINAFLSEADSSQPAYIIREHNGTVCVFHSKYSEVPAIITEITMDKLGESDQSLLSDGIEANTREEVLMYLEDFGS